MFPLIWLAAAAAVAAPSGDRLAEARYALDSGRFEQARAMVAAELAKGAKGADIERLLGDLAYASGKHGEALARYEALMIKGDSDPLLLERSALAALRTGARMKATGLIEQAVIKPGASWRAWNARGVIADLRNDFATADESYERALSMAPQQGEILNNIGWSRLLRGEWAAAIESLEQAALDLPSSSRVANNLELARAALAGDLPQRRRGESDAAYAARLNDAGVAAQARGESARAVAAFARAIDTRASWYERAAKNLEQVEKTQ